jgi:acetylglutamate kinase
VTRVIKIGGRPQGDPALASTLAAGWTREGGGMVLVHGGGDEVTALQQAFGMTSSFVGGRRVTTAQDIELVRMALSGSANKRLVSTLVQQGISAVGLSGEDASLISANPMDAKALGHVGVPSCINVAFLRHLLSGGYLPVISPVSRNGSDELGAGGALNVNGDDAAAAIAIALGAAELLLVADVAGVMRDGAVISRLSLEEARNLMSDGTARGGMQAKLHAALTAVEGGVPQVRISDILAIDDLTRGTVLRRAGGGGGLS